MADDRRQQLADKIRAAAQAAEDTPCDMGVVVGREDDDCPSCSAPVQVSSTIDGRIVSVYADVDGLVTLLLPLLDRVAAAAAAEALMTAFREDRTTVAQLGPVERLSCFLVKAEDLVARAAELRAPARTDEEKAL